MRIFLCLTSFVLMSILVWSQDFPYEIPEYDFVNYDENKIDFPVDRGNFQPVFEKIERLIFEGEGNIRIVHIGGSHIQADIFSDALRQRLQLFFPGNSAGRGFIFPYSMAKTNNPWNYSVKFTGEWDRCRNIEKKSKCKLGLSGISVETQDTLTSLKIGLNEQAGQPYGVSKIRVFHEVDSASFSVMLRNDSSVLKTFVNSDSGYTEFYLNEELHEFELVFRKTDSLQRYFRLYGLDLQTEKPGFYYNAIGVNGADVPAYLRCRLFSQHLAALRPDLVVLSIGINDAYTTRFDSEKYSAHYDSLLQMIRSAAPDAAILWTTNNDSYYKRRYPNENALVVKEVMYKLAEKYNQAVWDMFEVMGGLGSIKKWQNEGMAKSDKIHFTSDGYRLIGALLFNAFMREFDHYLKDKYHLMEGGAE